MRRWHADGVADVLWATASALAIVAVALRLWPARDGARDLPSVVPVAAPAPSGSAPALGGLELADAVVRADPFSAARTPPRVRWTPPAVDTLPLGLAPDPKALAALAQPPSAPALGVGDGPPRFYGTVIDPQGAAALLWLDARVPGAQLYRAGDRAGGWRVLRVSPDRVLLASPAGTRVTMRLQRERASAPPDTAPPDSAPPVADRSVP